jgi:predicted Zn-dependent protease
VATFLFEGYVAEKAVDEAIEIAELAVANTEWREDPVLLQRYALFLADHEAHAARAQELCLRAVALAPDDPAVHDRAGDVYERCGMRAMALGARRRALELAGATERAKYERRLRKLEEASG